MLFNLICHLLLCIYKTLLGEKSIISWKLNRTESVTINLILKIFFKFHHPPQNISGMQMFL